MSNKQQPDTIAATALCFVDEKTDAMAAPLRPSTSFLRDPEHLNRVGRKFTRDDNPSYEQPEAVINALEGGAGCLLFASGMSAITSVFHTLKPGDHVLLPLYVYSGLRDWLNKHGSRWGLKISYLEDYSSESVAQALVPNKTKLVWIETPSNPTWEVTDIAGISAVAHAAGALVAIDNTVATPVITRPLEHGVDIVVHSGSKYLNGHGDLIAGALIVAQGQQNLLLEISRIRNEYGGILGSFESWLLLRGMRTLFLRVKTASSNAMQIAEFLQQHKAVARVRYPGLESHPQHLIAKQQMRYGFGGMLSFQVKGGEAEAKAIAGRVKLIRQAISFGSPDTVIEHRAGMEDADSPTPRDLLRLSVGIEHIDDLLADLKQALDGDLTASATPIGLHNRRIRLGLIVPASNTNAEPDCQLLAPKGVTTHVTRSGGYDVNAIPDSSEMRRFARQSLDQQLQMLIDARVDVIAYACTSATLSDGPDFDREFCEEIQRKSGRPAVTAAGALVDAIHALGLKRVAFTSPYVKTLADESVNFIQQCGIEVVHQLGFEQDLDSLQQGALTPNDAYDMALKADHVDAEGIVISCTDYRALEAVPAIEKLLQKPVVTSNQALMYASIKLLGIEADNAETGGRLFSTR